MAEIAKELRRLANTQIEDDLRYINAADALMVEAAGALDAKDERIAELSVGWQPIETAPKDGTRVLIWQDAAYLAWFELEYTWVSGGGAWISERARSDTYEYAPTLWHPLPVPPSLPSSISNG